jgi:hypothetical protein
MAKQVFVVLKERRFGNERKMPGEQVLLDSTAARLAIAMKWVMRPLGKTVVAEDLERPAGAADAPLPAGDVVAGESAPNDVPASVPTADDAQVEAVAADEKPSADASAPPLAASKTLPRKAGGRQPN